VNYQTGPAPLPQPNHPLDYWLSAELARISPESAPSRLRQIAGARGAVIGAWAAGIGIGGVLVLLGGLLALQLKAPTLIPMLGIPGAALIVLCGVFCSRAGNRLPRTDRALVNRGPGGLRGALSFVGFVLVAFVVLFAFTAKPSTWQDPSLLLVPAMVLVFVTGLLVAAIIVPATIIGRSRESLRRKVADDPRFRALLEQDLATWRDPFGNAGYGPL
jgi:hypothetical protein